MKENEDKKSLFRCPEPDCNYSCQLWEDFKIHAIISHGKSASNQNQKTETERDFFISEQDFSLLSQIGGQVETTAIGDDSDNNALLAQYSLPCDLEAITVKEEPLVDRLPSLGHQEFINQQDATCLLYTSPSPRDS